MKKYNILKLDEITEISSGKVAPQEKKYYENGIHRFIRVKHFAHLDNGILIGAKCNFINDQAVNDKKLRLSKKGTIVFPKSGMAIMKNNIAILKYDSYIVNHLASLTIKEKIKVYDKYLLYYLKNFSIPKLAFNVSYPSIRLSDISKISVVLPSYFEQKRIADYLHRLDVLKEKRKNNNKKTFKLKLSKFLEFFGHPFKSKWNYKTIKEVSNIKSGFAKKPNVSNKGIPQLRTYNITASCSLNLDTFKYIDPIDKIENYRIKKGDVLFNNTNSIDLVGKNAVYAEPENYVFSNHITRIRTNKEVLPEYLWGVLTILYEEEVFKTICHKWVNQAGIDTKSIGNVKIPIPPLKLQEKYSSFLKSLNVLEKTQKESFKLITNLCNNKIKEIFSRYLVGISK